MYNYLFPKRDAFSGRLDIQNVKRKKEIFHLTFFEFLFLFRQMSSRTRKMEKIFVKKREEKKVLVMFDVNKKK